MMKGKGKRILALMLAATLFFSVPALREFRVIAEEQAEEAPVAEKKEAAPAEKAPAEDKPENKPADKPADKVETPDTPSAPEAPAATQAPNNETPASTPAPETPASTPAPAASASTPQDPVTSAPENTATVPAEGQTPAPEEGQPVAPGEATPEPLPTENPEQSPETSVEPTPSPTPEPPSFELLSRSKSHANNHLDADRLSIPKEGMAIPQIYQYDYGWAVCLVDGKNKSVASSGCGATSASMLIAYIAKNYDQTPYTLFYWAARNGRYRGDGLDFATVKQMLSNYGIHSKVMGVSADGIVDALNANRPIIILMGPGTFTKAGHYIVLRGLDDSGKVLVNDPNSASRSAQSFSLDLIVREAKGSHMLVAYTQPEEAADEEALPDESEDMPIPALSTELQADATRVPDVEEVIRDVTAMTPGPAAEATPAPVESSEATPETTRAPFTTDYEALVSSECVNLRTTPGTGGEIAAQLNQGALVRVVEEIAMASGNIWCGVDYEGQTLYLMEKYLTRADAEQAEAQAVAQPEETLPAASAEPLSETEDGRFEEAYLAQVCTEQVNLRTTPGTGGEIAAQLNQGALVRVVEEREMASGNIWCGVDYEGQTLYLMEKYLTRADAAQAEAQVVAQPEETLPVASAEPLSETEDGRFEEAYLAQVRADRVNLREVPGGEGLVIGSVPQGTTLCVVGEELCAQDGYVWCVVLYQKQRLYMRGDMLEKIS